ncbi:MAG TPA: hypothetical protein VFK02_16045 [Kofleriaceae bacterium]|nr:hypothetical protein [Kofleriaceae bacterium]
MLNDILTGRATLEGEKKQEADPFREPGKVQSITCATCSAQVPVSQAVGTRCRRCLQPAIPAPPLMLAPSYDPQIDHDLARAEQRGKGRTEAVLGAVLILVGIIISSATYSSASQEGGTYIIAYGPIIVGAIKLLRGLARAGG